MDNNYKNPEVRFKGFTEDWTTTTLGNIADSFEYGLNASAIKFDGINKYIRITDINDKTNKFNTNSLTSPGIDLEFADNFKLQEGDLLFARTGASVGKTYLYNTSDGLVYYAGFLIRARLNPIHDSYFIFQNTLTDDYKKYIRITSQRSGQPGVNAQEYSEYKLIIPKPTEQKQIGSFFQNLDNLITLHQKKYDKLVVLKKAMLVKMFPKKGALVPEIRFKGFTKDWEIGKLGETKTYFTDGNYGEAYPSSNDLTNSEIGVPFLRGSNLSNGVLSKNGANFITNSKHAELTSGHLVEDDIVIAVRGSLGALGYVNILNVGWNINSQLAIIRTNKLELEGSYLIQYLLSDFGQRIIHSKSTGTALKQLPIGKLKEIEIPLTNIEEQKKIGKYFQNLDNQIALHKTQLDKLNNIKKACFSKMFVVQD